MLEGIADSDGIAPGRENALDAPRDPPQRLTRQAHTAALLASLRVFEASEAISGTAVCVPLATVTRFWHCLGLTPLTSLTTLAVLHHRGCLAVCRRNGCPWEALDDLLQALEAAATTTVRSIVPRVVEQAPPTSILSNGNAEGEPTNVTEMEIDFSSSFAFDGAAPTGSGSAAALLRKYRLKLELMLDGAPEGHSGVPTFVIHHNSSGGGTTTDDESDAMLADVDHLDLSDVVVVLTAAQREVACRLAERDECVAHGGRSEEGSLCPPLEALHRMVVDAYTSMLPREGGHAMGPRDGYYFRHLERHVRACGAPMPFMTLRWRLALMLNTDDTLWGCFPPSTAWCDALEKLLVSASVHQSAGLPAPSPGRDATAATTSESQNKTGVGRPGTPQAGTPSAAAATVLGDTAGTATELVDFFRNHSSIVAHHLRVDDRKKSAAAVEERGRRQRAAAAAEAAAAHSRFLGALFARRSDVSDAAASMSMLLGDDFAAGPLVTGSGSRRATRSANDSPYDSRASSVATMRPANEAGGSSCRSSRSTSTIGAFGASDAAVHSARRDHTWTIPSAEYQFHVVLHLANHLLPSFEAAVEAILADLETAALARPLVLRCLPDMAECRLAVVKAVQDVVELFASNEAQYDIDESELSGGGAVAKLQMALSLLQETQQLVPDWDLASARGQRDADLLDALLRLHMRLWGHVVPRRPAGTDIRALMAQLEQLVRHGHALFFPLQLVAETAAAFSHNLETTLRGCIARGQADSVIVLLQRLIAVGMCCHGVAAKVSDSPAARALVDLRQRSRLASVRAVAAATLARGAGICPEQRGVLSRCVAEDLVRCCFDERGTGDLSEDGAHECAAAIGASPFLRLLGAAHVEASCGNGSLVLADAATWDLLPPSWRSALQAPQQESIDPGPGTTQLLRTLGALRGGPRAALEQLAQLAANPELIPAALRSDTGGLAPLCQTSFWRAALSSLLEQRSLRPHDVVVLANALDRIGEEAHAHFRRGALTAEAARAVIGVEGASGHLRCLLDGNSVLFLLRALTTELRASSLGRIADAEAVAALVTRALTPVPPSDWLALCFRFVATCEMNRGTRVNFAFALRFATTLLRQCASVLLGDGGRPRKMPTGRFIAQHLGAAVLGPALLHVVSAAAGGDCHGGTTVALEFSQALHDCLWRDTAMPEVAPSQLCFTPHGADPFFVDSERSVWVRHVALPVREILRRECFDVDGCPRVAAASGHWELLLLLPPNERFLLAVFGGAECFAKFLRCVCFPPHILADPATAPPELGSFPLLQRFQTLRCAPLTVTLLLRHWRECCSQLERRHATHEHVDVTIFELRACLLRHCIAWLPRGDGAGHSFTREAAAVVVRAAVMDQHHRAASQDARGFVDAVLATCPEHAAMLAGLERLCGD